VRRMIAESQGLPLEAVRLDAAIVTDLGIE
jgi:hypothetical protein